MDQPVDKGGDDAGFSSGELLLLALGSCVAAGMKRYFVSLDQLKDDLWVEVEQLPKNSDNDLSEIVVTLGVKRPNNPEQARSLIDCALSGNVGQRMSQCGDIKVQFTN